MRLLALGALAVLLLCGACDGGSDASPTATPSPTPTDADGTGYGLITASDGSTVTWDPVVFRGDACKAGLSEASTYQQQFEACYSNPEAILRTAPLDPETKVLVRPGNDQTRTVTGDHLAEVITAATGDIPPPYRVWRIAVSGGKVVAIEQATLR